MTARYIGLMSGTSLDAIDVVSILLENANTIKVESVLSHPIPSDIRQKIIHSLLPTDNELNTVAQLDRELGELFADAVLAFLEKYSLAANDVVAIGSHGQTIRHFPEEAFGFSLQIGDPNTIAVRTGIDVIADFRKKDIALGGQGAPLVPAFHQQIFSNKTSNIILNLGGIANLTFLPLNEAAFGFDTGPGNTLIDQWFQQKHSSSNDVDTLWDHDGEWAKSGQLHRPLLDMMLSDEYFHRQGPKSTGREYFNLTWLDKNLAKASASNEPAADIQRTLCELTAQSVINAVKNAQRTHDYQSLILCGGGAYNRYLRTLLENALPTLIVTDSSEFGIDVDWIEAAAFAWFAHCFIQRTPSNVPEVTGASRHAVLGCLFPAA